jgi:hypothetical protein
MKIKLLTSMAGVHHSWAAGDIVEIPSKEARRLIDAGFAEAILTTPKVVENAKAIQAGAERRGKSLVRDAVEAVKGAVGKGRAKPKAQPK